MLLMVRNADWFFQDEDDQQEFAGCRSIPRDLLPWADPYIAALMANLEREYLSSLDADSV
jgi:hypothetical protein